ncbi:MAG: thioredoxin domain-containing protein [Parcubacteria group bacterium]|nr:thioredoxin domain-containing protein [Parcubacteria group bacterium]
MKKYNWTQIAVVIAVLAIFGGILIYATTSNKNDNLKGEAVSTIDGDKVVLEEYSDFQCPACAGAAQVVSELKKRNSDRLEVKFNDFPLSMHKYAPKASEAAQCAKDQEKFWEYHDVLFQNQRVWSQAKDGKDVVKYFKKYAKELGLDTKQFDTSLDSGEKKAYVDDMTKKALDKKISATPTFYLNGKKVENYKTWDEFIEKVEAEL